MCTGLVRRIARRPPGPLSWSTACANASLPSSPAWTEWRRQVRDLMAVPSEFLLGRRTARLRHLRGLLAPRAGRLGQPPAGGPPDQRAQARGHAPARRPVLAGQPGAVRRPGAFAAPGAAHRGRHGDPGGRPRRRPSLAAAHSAFMLALLTIPPSRLSSAAMKLPNFSTEPGIAS